MISLDKENASWNLRDMFESDEAWEAQLAEVRGLVDRLAAQGLLEEGEVPEE